MFILLLILIFVVFFCGKIIGSGEKAKLHLEPFYSRKLCTKREPYVAANFPEWARIALKHGQRKLLFVELEFYIQYLEPGDKIVYAGAANGRHEIAICELFPNNKLDLYDSNPFYEDLKKYPNVTMYNRYFTNEDAQRYNEESKINKILFIVDIRVDSDVEVVAEDMERQRNWCVLMQPKMAMLKFRLHWDPGQTEYFDGEIYTQPRVGHSSTEMRLWTDCKSTKKWDNDEYNDRCYYFNVHIRNAYHEIDNFEELAKEIKGLDHCYDCWSEIEICKQYLQKYGPIPHKKYWDYHEVIEKNPIAALMNFLGGSSMQFLNVPPHGMFPNERDIVKKMHMLESETEKYINKLINKKLSYEKK